MSRKLWEIDDDIRNFEFEIDEETGEILNPYALDDLQMERESKIENIACLIKELRAEADAITNEAKSLKERADKRKNKADRLEDYLDYALQGNAFSTTRCEVTYKKSYETIIDDINSIPKEFIKEVVDIKPDKMAIKKAINGGTSVNGAHILEKNNIKVN